MKPYLIMWPKSEEVSHINYHYTQLGEIVDYLDKKLPVKGIVKDCDVETCDIIELIKQKQIKKVVMNVAYENVKNSMELAEKIKENFEDVVILGYGQVTTMLPKIFKESKFDAIYKDGDSEICIKSFLENFETDSEMTKEKFCKLKGLSVIKSNKIVPVGKGEFISSEDWGISRKDRVPVEKYDKIKNKNRFVINDSRGCPFGCPHCLIQLTEGNKERRRSIKNFDEAIEEIKKDYKHIKIWAANFTLDKKYANEFCDMMIEKHPDVTWETATRIDLVKDIELLKKMKQAGCRQISLGVESLNNADLINTKDFSANQVDKVIKAVNQAGIKVKGCIMLGMPNQTKESIVNTIKFLLDRGVTIRPTIYTPYQLCDENTTIDELTNYNRKTYKNNNVPGVSHEQLIRLVKEPEKYEEILNVKNQTRVDYKEDDEAR